MEQRDDEKEKRRWKKERWAEEKERRVEEKERRDEERIRHLEELMLGTKRGQKTPSLHNSRANKYEEEKAKKIAYP